MRFCIWEVPACGTGLWFASRARWVIASYCPQSALDCDPTRPPFSKEDERLEYDELIYNMQGGASPLRKAAQHGIRFHRLSDVGTFQ